MLAGETSVEIKLWNDEIVSDNGQCAIKKNKAVQSSAMGHYETASSARWHYEKSLIVIQLDPQTPRISHAQKLFFPQIPCFSLKSIFSKLAEVKL